MLGRPGARPKRHSAELYDAVWGLAWTPRAEVHESMVRLVLLVMASFTNPTRDQVYGPAGEWRCWASIGKIATLAGLSDRQVQRVLGVLNGLRYIEVEKVAVRAGRNRTPRPTLWRLRPDIWPIRSHGRDTDDTTINGRAIDDTTIGDSEMVATPEVDGHDTDDAERSMVATQRAMVTSSMSPEPVTPEPVTPVEPIKEEPARARARDAADFRLETTPETNGRTNGRHPTKPTCPDCQAMIDDRGRGHQRSQCEGRLPDVHRCSACHEWLDDRPIGNYHSLRCPLRPNGTAKQAVEVA